jgi:hypothetical protein
MVINGEESFFKNVHWEDAKRWTEESEAAGS